MSRDWTKTSNGGPTNERRTIVEVSSPVLAVVADLQTKLALRDLQLGRAMNLLRAVASPGANEETIGYVKDKFDVLLAEVRASDRS